MSTSSERAGSRPDVRPDLKSLLSHEISGFLAGMGEPSYRGAQVFSWIHEKGAASFDEMTNLPLALRRKLDEVARLANLEVLARRPGTQGTVKYLLGLGDGNSVEAVRMKYTYGTSACVSTQVGCKMACAFCASGAAGFVRNLTPGEIVDQVLKMNRDLTHGSRTSREPQAGSRIGWVVLMGTGEPLDNYDASVKALRILNAEEGLNVSHRRMTVSTCGLVPGIRRLAEEGIPVTLSISLHAPTDDLRDEIIPINRRYPIPEVTDAASFYATRTGRRVTFEYALIRDVNDDVSHARRLAGLLSGMLAHVNLIPLNPVKERGYARPPRERVMRFLAVLKEARIPVTIRRELGLDIDAACGQLRRRYCR
ncbi:MAG: 23S rRNA (adenine(2503)-C(2))-methyltransferase RlmN [Bacteroidota bacterium]